ncbi:MAG: metallophosphoesterase family protein [Clostridia bacterium]|nr:metallophosphoesterase family protein [Clostridia bacterium]
MKNTKKVLSIFLSVLLLCSAVVPAGAVSVWDIYWSDTEEAARGIIMQPGKDESERNFSWYMPESVTDCFVEISLNPLMLSSEKIEGDVTDDRHGNNVAKVTVSELEEGKTYYYTCISGDSRSDVYSFETVAGDSFSALYMSDIHITLNEETGDTKDTAFAFADLLAEVTLKHDINMILSAGDQATDGLLTEYQGLTFSPLSRSLTFATAIGNHDRKGIAYKYFTNLPNEDEGMISSPQGGNYYFTKGEVLFLVIDSNNASATDHRNFIKKAVSENEDLKWRVVMMHHDLYGGSIEHRESENELLRMILSPIFDEFNIDLVLTGHSHHYSISHVLYNGEIAQELENGGTVNNAEGTVYMVSASVGRARDEEGVYSERIAIGMEDFNDKLYNIIDFSEDAIKVTSYERGEGEFASFTLTKDDDFDAPEISFFRKLIGQLLGAFGTIYAFFNNIGRYHDLTEDGFNVDFFETVF